MKRIWRTSPDLLRFSTRSMASALGFIAVIVMTAGCTKENPTITATNQPNETGGTLQISGSGFTGGFPVSVSVLNVPGTGKPWSEKAGNATTGGTINVTVSYTYVPDVPALPGCKTNNFTSDTLNVTAADDSTHAFGATRVAVQDCGWATPQVTNHQ